MTMTKQERNKQYYLKNRERLLAAQKTRDLLRIEEKRKYMRQYHAENKEALAFKKRAYREANIDYRKAKMKEWYQKNREYAIAKAKEYRNINKSVLNRKSNAYKFEREATDPLFKLKRRLRTLIYTKLKNQGYTKRSKTFEILGCSFEEFQNHISAQFLEGMSWDNHGKWHLDHIVPIASAFTEEDVIRLNHYSNFQPLWALDNLVKGSRYD